MSIQHGVALIVLSIATLACQQSEPEEPKTFLFVGTYNGAEVDTGIYVYQFDPNTGQLDAVYQEKNVTNPSYLNISPNGSFLYASVESQSDQKGSVTAFRIDTTNGHLTFLNKQPAGGRNPVYVDVHPSGKYVVNANYTDAGVSIYSCKEDGSLNEYLQLLEFQDSSIIENRQGEAHVHSANFSPDGRYIFAPDLGGDKIRVFEFDPPKLTYSEKLTVNSVPGSGPRHFTFHPNGNYAYCVEELSGMISSYRYENGVLDSIGRDFSYSKVYDSYGAADIHISPDGKFLYASNRVTENSISIFAIDPANGTLDVVGHQDTFGDHPRNFTIDLTGKYLLVANKNSDTIVVFKRDMETGLLTKTETEVEVKQPSCLKFVAY